MSKKSKYIVSKMDDLEIHYFLEGECTYFSPGNGLSDIMKIIGKHEELHYSELNESITDYHPENDRKPKYENKGISAIRDYYNARAAMDAESQVSKRIIRKLTHNLRMHRIMVWKLTDSFIQYICQYLDESYNIDCKLRVKKYIEDKRNAEGVVCYGNWSTMMPNHCAFLRTRAGNISAKNHDIACRIVNEIEGMEFNR